MEKQAVGCKPKGGVIMTTRDQMDEKIEALSAQLRAADARVLKLERSNAALARQHANLLERLAVQDGDGKVTKVARGKMEDDELRMVKDQLADAVRQVNESERTLQRYESVIETIAQLVWPDLRKHVVSNGKLSACGLLERLRHLEREYNRPLEHREASDV